MIFSGQLLDSPLTLGAYLMLMVQFGLTTSGLARISKLREHSADTLSACITPWIHSRGLGHVYAMKNCKIRHPNGSLLRPFWGTDTILSVLSLHVHMKIAIAHVIFDLSFPHYFHLGTSPRIRRRLMLRLSFAIKA